VQKTYYPKAADLQPKWYLADAAGQNLGRFASKVASTLLGKGKPDFTPGVATGDYVVVVNAEQVRVTGTKTSLKLDTKSYHHHSGYPGGLKSVTLREQLRKHPDRVFRSAVWGMLPHTKSGRAILKRLKVYGGAKHPHGLQNPEPLK
jgi:large subunit ribosomal protein L13